MACGIVGEFPLVLCGAFVVQVVWVIVEEQVFVRCSHVRYLDCGGVTPCGAWCVVSCVLWECSRSCVGVSPCVACCMVRLWECSRRLGGFPLVLHCALCCAVCGYLVGVVGDCAPWVLSGGWDSVVRCFVA